MPHCLGDSWKQCSHPFGHRLVVTPGGGVAPQGTHDFWSHAISSPPFSVFLGVLSLCLFPPSPPWYSGSLSSTLSHSLSFPLLLVFLSPSLSLSASSLPQLLASDPKPFFFRLPFCSSPQCLAHSWSVWSELVRWSLKRADVFSSYDFPGRNYQFALFD